jgi:signal transduction histidine kinase
MRLINDYLMKSLPSILLVLILFLFSSKIFAGEKELSSRIYDKQKQIEQIDVYNGSDSLSEKEYSNLKLLLDSFITIYSPNKQYVISLNYYANHIRRNNPRKAIDLLQDAEQICEKDNYDTLKAFITHDLASIYFQKDLLNEAYSLFVESADYFKAINDMPAYGYALIDIGNVYYRKGQYDLALDYYLQSEEVFKSVMKNSDKAWGLALSYDNIGQVFVRKENFDSSLYYFNASIKIKHDNDLKSSYYNSYLTLSDLYSYFGNIDSSIYYSTKAIDICKKQNQYQELAFAYYSYGEKIMEQDTSLALEYLHKSYDLSKQNNSVLILRSLNSFTKYYINHNIDSALFYGEKLYDNSKLFNNNFFLNNAIDYLVSIHEIMGNYKEEIKFMRLQVNRLEKDNENKLFQSELINEASKWAKERDDLQEAQKRDALIRNFQTVIVVIVLIFSFFLLRARKKIKNAAMQLEVSNKQLQKTLETKDMVYSIVAHDLRGPVGSSLGLIKLMDDENIDSESFLEVVPTMRKSMQETYNLLENLLSWAQINKHEINLKKERFKLCEIVKESEKLHQENAISKGISIINSTYKGIEVFADRSSVATVIRNLISNALKFTPENGEIRIQVVEKEKFVEISVKDTGAGMDKDTLNSIFDKNKTVTKRGTNDEKGSGLGLKLCWEFVNMNGGEIWAQSEVGKGSTFTFTLPKNEA